jgi:hypothetical protein
MFVTTGGLDMLLTRTLQHTQRMAAVGADGSGGGAPPDLLLQLLVFLQTLLGWGIGESVRRGALWHESVCDVGWRVFRSLICLWMLLLGWGIVESVRRGALWHHHIVMLRWSHVPELRLQLALRLGSRCGMGESVRRGVCRRICLCSVACFPARSKRCCFSHVCLVAQLFKKLQAGCNTCHIRKLLPC